MLGSDYQRGAELVNAFHVSPAEYWPQTTVWSLNARRQIGILRNGQAALIRAERVILANGAMERLVSFPEWTLPGVMNVGAAQILMKSAGVVPAQGTVIVGLGPLPFLVAGLPLIIDNPLSEDNPTGTRGERQAEPQVSLEITLNSKLPLQIDRRSKTR